jgi:hypothetical protein
VAARPFDAWAQYWPYTWPAIPNSHARAAPAGIKAGNPGRRSHDRLRRQIGHHLRIAATASEIPRHDTDIAAIDPLELGERRAR